MIRRIHLLLAGLLLAGIVSAESLQEIQDRMKLRKPAIQSVLTSGKAGEGNTGYLVAIKTMDEAEKAALAAENKDRAAVYTQIAERNTTTAEKVGSQRAAKIAEIAPAGTQIQSSDGAWKAKE